MITQKLINEFLSHQPIAVVGVSRNTKKFGYSCYRDLKIKGFNVVPVNHYLDNIDGEKCFPNLYSIPFQIGAVLIIVKPEQTIGIIKDAFVKGIRYIWMQQGAESEEAIGFCKANDINLISGKCILMFAQPVVSFHKFHRWFVKLIGKFPV
jgi:predicted CoA-binding protein